MKLLLEGRPGVGKTTVLLKVVKALGSRAGGFITQEVRKGRSRVGFVVRDLDGREALMAHISFKGPRVGRYGVSVHAFEEVALSALREAMEKRDLVVIDEIGKMELLSEAFKELVLDILGGGKPVLATLSLARDPFLERVRGMGGVEILRVTLENRDLLPGRILQKLREVIG
ncbi:MAG: AAA family ATPase [Deltaproteobacteria bacterium]|nr:MAG: AAA family ATPase [Deltaproteobacteria bacterium]